MRNSMGSEIQQLNDKRQLKSNIHQKRTLKLLQSDVSFSIIVLHGNPTFKE